MVGTGVFTTSGFLLGDLKSPLYVLIVWVLGGIVATLGALSYGALARRIPESGGEYVFLSRTLHPAAGYVAGWVSLLVGFSAPLALAAFAFGKYSQPWWHGGGPLEVFCHEPRWAGAVLIVLFSGMHAAHVQGGAWAQNAAVLLKVVLIVVFAGFAFTRLEIPSLGTQESIPVSTFAISLMWVSLSYSGWNAAIYIGEEVKDAERNVPRAMFLGTLLVTVLYLALNAIFVFAAPISALEFKPEVGRIAAEALGGPGWGNAVASLVALVLISSVSAQVMAGPRVCAKMAADGYLPRFLAPREGPPRSAIVLQCLLALLMLWTTTFEWLFTYIGFTLGICTATTVFGLMVLRRREGPSLHVPGWPVVPAAFLLATVLITVLSVRDKPYAILAGALSIGAGLVAWYLSEKVLARPAPARVLPSSE
jgi:APA family basic amino acid/polyamine antiporter